MKKLIKDLIIYLAIIAAIVADEFYKIEYVGNLAIFAVWFFIILGFLVLLADPKELFVNMKYHTINKIIPYLMIMFMVAIGWTFTGVFYFLSAILLHLKYCAYSQAKKKSGELEDDTET